MVTSHKHLVKSSFEIFFNEEKRRGIEHITLALHCSYLHCGITTLICQLAISEDERHSIPEHNPNTFACVILPTQANMEVQL